MTETTKRQVKRMLGEFFREAAVLVAVFAPLDLVLRDRDLTTLYWLKTIAVVGACLLLGILLEIDSDD
jgi:hypothetical protein